MIEFSLPFPPSVNSLFGGGSAQKRFKSKKYKEWEKSCPVIPMVMLDKPVTITLTYFLPDMRLRDIDNYSKAVIDKMVNDGVLMDDNFKIIQELIARFGGVDKGNPRVEARIALID
jgi:Holliday junction resolvase RusA-like endonuclease